VPFFCANNALLPREWVEANVVAGIKRDLRSPVVIEEISRRVRVALRAGKPKAPDQSTQVAQLKTEVANLVDAIASGALRASPSLAARLAAAEGELERLTAVDSQPATKSVSVTRILADLPARAARALEQLDLYGDQGQMAAGLLRAAAASTASFYGSRGGIRAVPSIPRSERVK
jgi:hypothetical protein